jgi:putative oxidoreductase
MIDTVSKNLLVPLVLRFGLAVLFVNSGLIKIVGPENHWGATWWTNDPNLVKPLAAPIQIAVAWAELIGGLLLAVGLMTRLAAAGLALIMAGTIYWYTGEKGFKGGYDYNLAIIVMCTTLVISGGGTLAVDRMIRIKRRMFT